MDEEDGNGLARSEARFRAAVEAVNGVLWTNDANGMMTGEQPGWAALTGQKLAEYQGYGWASAIHPEDAQPTVDAWNQAVAARRTFEFEHRVRRRDGKWRVFAIRAVPIIGGCGTIREWVGVHTDVTDRRSAEAALSQSEARLRLAHRIGGVGAFEIDVARGKATFSEGYERLHGLAPGHRHDGIDGWLERIVPEDRARVAADLAAAGSGGKTSAIHYRIRRQSDGAVRWITERREVFEGADGKPTRIIGLQQDVTEQRQAAEVLSRDKEELERLVETRTQDLRRAQEQLAHARRLDALGQLAGGIAHDFNNVLQAVQGAATLIERRHDEPERIRRLARVITEASDRGSAITRRLLAFSRQGDLRTEPIAIHQMLTGLREMLTHTLGDGVGVRIDAPNRLPQVLADKGQLETVIVNLATNARDAMNGNGLLTLSASAATATADGRQDQPAGMPDGDYVRLSVTDTGSGMTAEVMSRATEPFFTTKEQGKGTGLGLSMAKGFAEQSGGGLSINSQAGAGTTVTVWLPVAPRQATGESGSHDHGAAADGRPRIRILVVDDDSLVRAVIGEHLEASGYEVMSAQDGESALAALDSCGAVDAIVSDLSMPGMNGVALIAAAQRRKTGLPAILLTGFATSETEIPVDDAADATFSLLRKPVDAGTLTTRVATLLREQR